jgi:hypothetical protein
MPLKELMQYLALCKISNSLYHWNTGNPLIYGYRINAFRGVVPLFAKYLYLFVLGHQADCKSSCPNFIKFASPWKVSGYLFIRGDKQTIFKTPQIANPQILGLIPLLLIRKFFCCACQSANFHS